MKVLILYGTTEGQTHKIAGFAADRLKRLGDAVTIVDTAAAPPDLRPDNFDAAILAASLHNGVYQRPFVDFVRAHHRGLNRLPTAFFSVSLSAAGREPDDLKHAATCVDFFRNETGWTGNAHHIAGAFRFSEYDFFKRWMMKIIAWERSLPVAGIQELELTDWDALGRIVDAFHEQISRRPAVPAA